MTGQKIASQVWLLSRSLFTIIGDRIPLQDEHRLCFQEQLRLFREILYPEINLPSLDAIRDDLETHHIMFTMLYQIPISPKMHFNIHSATEILRYV